MTVKIAIIGLGQIGGSIGLALAEHKDQVTTIGYDTASEVNRAAQKMGAVESTGHSLPAAVREAEVIVLALPLDQVRETLKTIAKEVRQQCIVLDTTQVKAAVAAWAAEFLPPVCHYVGLTPAINPLFLEGTGMGIEAAQADLFRNGLVAVTAPHQTAGDAIKLATSFVSLLGAHAFFADPDEVDGIMAAVHTLPALAAAALAETVIDQPGWSDIRKLAGRSFVAATRLLDLEDSTALAEEAGQSRTNSVRLLDEYIQTLKALRDEIEAQEGKKLKGRLERVVKARTQWRQARADGDWQNIESLEQKLPTFSDLWMKQLSLGRMFGLGRKKDEED